MCVFHKTETVFSRSASHQAPQSTVPAANSSRVVFVPTNAANGRTSSGSARPTNYSSKSTPKKRVGSDFSSPTMVSTDVSTPGSGSERSGTPTPSTPPPRHVKKMSADESEVWYQKWWMCGFTDALNLNGN